MSDKLTFFDFTSILSLILDTLRSTSSSSTWVTAGLAPVSGSILETSASPAFSPFIFCSVLSKKVSISSLKCLLTSGGSPAAFLLSFSFLNAAVSFPFGASLSYSAFSFCSDSPNFFWFFLYAAKASLIRLPASLSVSSSVPVIPNAFNSSAII